MFLTVFTIFQMQHHKWMITFGNLKSTSIFNSLNFQKKFAKHQKRLDDQNSAETSYFSICTYLWMLIVVEFVKEV